MLGSGRVQPEKMSEKVGVPLEEWPAGPVAPALIQAFFRGKENRKYHLSFS